MSNIAATGHAEELNYGAPVDDRLVPGDLRNQILDKRLAPGRQQQVRRLGALASNQTGHQLLEQAVSREVTFGLCDQLGELLRKHRGLGQGSHPKSGCLVVAGPHLGSHLAGPDPQETQEPTGAVLDSEQIAEKAGAQHGSAESIRQLSEDLGPELGVGGVGVHRVEDGPDALQLLVVPADTRSVDIGRAVAHGHDYNSIRFSRTA